MSHFVTQSEVEQKRFTVEFQRQIRIGLDAIYADKRWEQIRPCDANDQAIFNSVSLYKGKNTVPTPELFHEMSLHNPYWRKRFIWMDVEQQKEILRKEIIEVLQKRGWTKHDLATEERKLVLTLPPLTRDELRERLSVEIRNSELLGKSVVELKADLAASRQQPEQKILPAEWTKARLTDPSTSSETLKSLIRRWGIEAVNDRLLGRS